MKEYSITRWLSISIIVTVVVVLGISTVISYYLITMKARSILSEKADEYISFIVNAIGEPIWYLNDRHIADIASYYDKNDYVSDLVIENTNGVVLYRITKKAVIKLISKESDIYFNDKLVGKAKISLTSKYYEELIHHMLWMSSIALCFIIVSLLFMVYILMKVFLDRPLHRLNQIISNYSAGKFNTEVSIRFLEFQPIVSLLRDMGSRIMSQIEELQQYSKGLEEMVAARTAELNIKILESEKQRLELSNISNHLEETNHALLDQIAERKRAEAELEDTVDQLRNALLEVKTLRGFISICSNCKKIRDDEGFWQQIEKYVQDRSNVQFSHGICPECARKLYSEFLE